jgi:hypothetical protein
MNARWLSLVFSMVLWLTMHHGASAADDQRVIGIEGDVTLMLDRGDYQPKPLDDRTPLILRIENITPAEGGRFSYDFHYIGFEPGTYPLSDYLVLPDGSPAVETAGVMVEVRSVLPPDHDGKLNPHVPRPFPWFGGYRMMLAGLAALWLLGLFAFYWIGRRRKVVEVVEIQPPPPSYAERMRPLVEAAAMGKLSVTGQAELERLMTGYWREKLSLPERRMADSLGALKRHPDAGALLLALERWLHRPEGASRDEIESLLEPYRHPSKPAEMEASA